MKSRTQSIAYLNDCLKNLSAVEQYKIADIKKELRSYYHLVRQFLLVNYDLDIAGKCIISGGCFSSLYHGKPPRDIDFFVSFDNNNELVQKFGKAEFDSNYLPCLHINYVHTFDLFNKKIQLIQITNGLPRDYPSSMFDYHHSMMYYYNDILYIRPISYICCKYNWLFFNRNKHIPDRVYSKLRKKFVHALNYVEVDDLDDFLTKLGNVI